MSKAERAVGIELSEYFCDVQNKALAALDFPHKGEVGRLYFGQFTGVGYL